MRNVNLVAAFALATLAIAPSAVAQDGAALFERDCAMCHDADEAPSREVLGELLPNTVVDALTSGTMRTVGTLLSMPERRALAEYLTGREVTAAVDNMAGSMCTESEPVTDPASGPRWNGWGVDLANTRFQPAAQGGLTAADLPRLTLKWAFGYPDVVAARAQPTVAGGRVFVGSEAGHVFALDAGSGCTYWIFEAQTGVRTAISVGPYRNSSGSGLAAYFADGVANAYAVDATTGEPLWMRRVDEHESARVTGAPTLHDGVVYVPTAGLGEEAQGGRLQYECCTFRGSVSALDASTGDVVWKSYVMPEPQSRGTNAEGVQVWGPSGGGIWAAPTVDVGRNALYVSTGNGYSEPAQPTTDAIVAFDLETGEMLWSRQTTPSDIWTMGCQRENPDNPNCPETLGPDADYSASPMLVTTPSGRDLVITPQKSGMVYALDPDNEGVLVWEYRAGEGSGLGGVWGAATDGERAYVAANDFFSPDPGGMNGVDLDTGERVWYTPPPARLCGEGRGCVAAQGAAVTAIPGAVFSGSHDGGLRAYSAEDGLVLWTYDTNRTFDTVNGVEASGGSLDGPGAVVVGGRLFFNSGYGGIVGRPGNVLLVFGVE